MKNSSSSYRQFKTIDFFNDAFFATAARSGKWKSDPFWLSVAAEHPESLRHMEEAAMWIMLIANQARHHSENSSEVWQKIQPQLQRLDLERNRIRRIKAIFIRAGQAAAIIIVAIAGYEITQQGHKKLQTQYAQKSHITLPDESEVDLNSNSSVRYVRNWKSDKPRELWLKGEALFKVKHLALKNRVNESDSFKVHAGGLLLTVTGTRFNVKDRRGIVRVSLLEGSLRVQDEKSGALLGQLKAGETLSYQSGREQISKRPDVKAATAWKNDEIHLDDLTLETLIADIEDNFGYDVVLQDQRLLKRHLSGTIPARNLDDILFVIRQTLKADVQVIGNQITIK